MNWFEKRKLRKEIKEGLHAAKHARNMREDVADPRALAELDAAAEAVREAQRTGDGEVSVLLERLSEAIDRVYPLANLSGVRENAEVIIVALAAAMAIRAFFFEPFKIPTGSLQPTLNGIRAYEAPGGPTAMDRLPFKFFKWLATGESYKVFRAKVSGPIDSVYGERDFVVLEIGGRKHRIPSYMRDMVLERLSGFSDANGRIDHYFRKGETIVAGKVMAGDHLLVNKMAYNFRRPQRGDIAVFDTRHVEHEQVRKGAFYIKRMVGLPGEKIQIRDGHIIADGKMVREPPVFERIATDPKYHGGYQLDGRSRLASPEDCIRLSDTEYLMFGDNTVPNMSLDGRFFGGVPREDFRGPATFVYWPFREHFGRIR